MSLFVSEDGSWVSWFFCCQSVSFCFCMEWCHTKVGSLRLDSTTDGFRTRRPFWVRLYIASVHFMTLASYFLEPTYLVAVDLSEQHSCCRRSACWLMEVPTFGIVMVAPVGVLTYARWGLRILVRWRITILSTPLATVVPTLLMVSLLKGPLDAPTTLSVTAIEKQSCYRSGWKIQFSPLLDILTSCGFR